MKNIKRLLAQILIFSITLTTTNFTFASENTSAEKLNSMGLLLNISDKELALELTRELGLTMILKSLGYTQTDADAAALDSPFHDVDGWFKGWAALAY